MARLLIVGCIAIACAACYDKPAIAADSPQALWAGGGVAVGHDDDSAFALWAAAPSSRAGGANNPAGEGSAQRYGPPTPDQARVSRRPLVLSHPPRRRKTCGPTAPRRRRTCRQLRARPQTPSEAFWGSVNGGDNAVQPSPVEGIPRFSRLGALRSFFSRPNRP